MLILIFNLPVFHEMFFTAIKNVTYLSAEVDVSTGYFHPQKQWQKPDRFRCGMCFQESCFHLPRNRQNRNETLYKMLYSENQAIWLETVTEPSSNAYYFEQF